MGHVGKTDLGLLVSALTGWLQTLHRHTLIGRLEAPQPVVGLRVAAAQVLTRTPGERKRIKEKLQKEFHLLSEVKACTHPAAWSRPASPYLTVLFLLLRNKYGAAKYALIYAFFSHSQMVTASFPQTRLFTPSRCIFKAEDPRKKQCSMFRQNLFELFLESGSVILKLISASLLSWNPYFQNKRNAVQCSCIRSPGDSPTFPPGHTSHSRGL